MCFIIRVELLERKSAKYLINLLTVIVIGNIVLVILNKWSYKMQHVHHDLIVEWLEDNSTNFQIKSLVESEGYYDCSIHAVIDNPDRDCRIKPREFKKGHWYPCVFKGGNRDSARPMYFNGEDFVSYKAAGSSFSIGNFSQIGESLGEIKFY